MNDWSLEQFDCNGNRSFDGISCKSTFLRASKPLIITVYRMCENERNADNFRQFVSGVIESHLIGIVLEFYTFIVFILVIT